MSPDLARHLAALNTRFYVENARSFDRTRQAPWPGWDRVLSLAKNDVLGAEGTSLHVLDVACGNLRFARFLGTTLPGTKVDYRGVDNFPDLARVAQVDMPTNVRARIDRVDVVGSLLDGKLECPFGADAAPLLEGDYSTRCGSTWSCADLVACFGFMHHVPTQKARTDLLRHLVRAARHGGIIAISFWRFMANDHLAVKAGADTTRALGELGIEEADLDLGDHLLGWQETPGAWRYCHSFAEEEVGRAMEDVADLARPIGHFRSDGRSGDLNDYLVLRRI